MSEHSKLPFRQGCLFDTARTRGLPKRVKAEYEHAESLRVFSGFLPSDEGRSRKMVALCINKEDAEFIVESCNNYERVTAEAIKYRSRAKDAEERCDALLEALKETNILAETAISMTPSGPLRNKLTEINIMRLQAIAEGEK